MNLEDKIRENSAPAQGFLDISFEKSKWMQKDICFELGFAKYSKELFSLDFKEQYFTCKISLVNSQQAPHLNEDFYSLCG